MSRLKQSSGIATIILAFASAIATAQTTMSIHIEVTDLSGAVVPEAFIGISDAASNAIVKHAAADSQGKLTIVLPAKPYHLTVASPGFRQDDREIDNHSFESQIRVVLQVATGNLSVTVAQYHYLQYLERPDIQTLIYPTARSNYPRCTNTTNGSKRLQGSSLLRPSSRRGCIR